MNGARFTEKPYGTPYCERAYEPNKTFGTSPSLSLFAMSVMKLSHMEAPSPRVMRLFEDISEVYKNMVVVSLELYSGIWAFILTGRSF